jgi:hypothetical protein
MEDSGDDAAVTKGGLRVDDDVAGLRGWHVPDPWL